MREAKYLIAMKGFPATGKSLLATALSHALSWPLIDKDDIKDYTLNLENGNVLAYEIMWSITRRQLSLDLSVIVDSPLTYPVAYGSAAELAAAHGAHLLVVETTLDKATWRARLEQRDPRQSTHKIAGWNAMHEMLRRYDGCWKYPIPERQHVVVDASLPTEVLLREVLARLQDSQVAGTSHASSMEGKAKVERT